MFGQIDRAHTAAAEQSQQLEFAEKIASELTPQQVIGLPACEEAAGHQLIGHGMRIFR